MGTTVKLGPNILFTINYPKFIVYILSLFRATGRFIWLPCYIIFTACMYLISKFTNRKTANFVIIFCLILQVIDFYPNINNKFQFKEDKIEIDSVSWEQTIDGAKHIVYFGLEEKSFEEMIEGYYKIAYIAHENKCTLNNFYFARQIDNVTETSQKYINDLQLGNLENGYIYVIKQNSENRWWNEKLKTYKLDGYIVITL